MIIDCHAHWGPWFFSMRTRSIGKNLAQLDHYRIDRQVLSAVEAIVYDPVSGNAALERELARADDPRLLGYVTIDPRELGAAQRDLQRLTGPRWVGVKIHTHYTRTPIASEPMARAIALATEHGLPVLLHTWGEDLLDLAWLAEKVPGSRLIAGHMGAASWRRIPQVAHRTDRVWFEPCWSQPDAGRVRWVLDEIGSDRLMFGTDATLIHPGVAIGAIEAAALSERERTAVMGANAAALFGIPDIARVDPDLL